MITGELRNKIDRLWETFWTGGITNPLDVVEQMTYLMFIHDLDETDNLRAKESAMLGLPHQSIFAGEVQVGDRTVAGEQLKWSRFHDFPAGQTLAIAGFVQRERRFIGPRLHQTPPLRRRTTPHRAIRPMTVRPCRGRNAPRTLLSSNASRGPPAGGMSPDARPSR